MRGDSQLIGSPRLTACLPRPVIAAAGCALATCHHLQTHRAFLGQRWVRICHHDRSHSCES